MSETETLEKSLRIIEENQKRHLQTINLYLGLFEEIFEKDSEFMDSDNYDDYKEVVRLHNILSDKPYNPTGIFRDIKEIEDGLPY